ncbi:MAG: penicillin-binding protein 2, partial [Burkholderiales bacterium]
MPSELSINPGIELRNAQLELHHFRVRLALAVGLVVLAFFLLAGRFFYLQVVRHGELYTLAEANRISIVPVAPNRGIVVDRNGVVLAHNYSAYTLEVQPDRIANLDKLIDGVATV